MVWTSNYSPVDDSVLASAGIVLIPIVVLFVMLFTTRVIYAAWTALILFIIIAAGMYHMPLSMAIIAACNGALYGAWPIGLIVFAAIFIFDMSVITGHFETVKYTIVSLTKDKRLLALLLAYSFSGFIEGASGFSTPVALACSMMIGVGFSKEDAAKAALLGNTIPVVFGGIGIPIITLSTVTKLPANALGIAASRLLIPFSLSMPFVIVYSISNFAEMLEVWPACLFVAVMQTGMSLMIAQFAGAQPVSIVSMICTLASLALFLRVWHPKRIIMTESMANEEAGMRTQQEVDVIAEGGSASPGAAVRRRARDVAALKLSSGPSGIASAASASDHVMAAHVSLRLDRAHPLSGPEGEASAAAAAAAGAGGALAPPDAAPSALVTQDGHVLLLRRVLIDPKAQRSLDSSSVGTALFPHTLEHEYSLRHRVHGKFVRVTRESGLLGDVLQRHQSSPAPSSSRNSAIAVGSGGVGGSPSASRQEGGASAAATAPASEPHSPSTPAASAAPSLASTTARHNASTSSLDAAAAHVDAAAVVVTMDPGAGAAGGAPPAPGIPTSTDATDRKPAAPPAKAAHHFSSHENEHVKEASGPQPEVYVHYDALHPPSLREVLTAWFPWVLVAVMVVIWGIPPVKGTIPPPTGLQTATLLISMTGLDGQVNKPDPTTGAPHIQAATWTLDLVGATGICLFICAILTSGVFQLPPQKTAWILWKSFRRMALSMFTISSLLALGYVIKFSGMDYTLGLAAAKTQKVYPFLSPLIGVLGVVISGSATTSCVLFGSLQIVAADQIGVNHVQMAAANVAGGVLGHIISTSSMVVAAVTTGADSKSIGPIARSVIFYALTLILLFACWNILVAYAFPSFIPSANYLT